VLDVAQDALHRRSGVVGDIGHPGMPEEVVEVAGLLVEPAVGPDRIGLGAGARVQP
jgi:hypothetical protein